MPVKIKIPVLKNVPSGTTISFYVLDIKNSQKSNYQTGVSANIMRKCKKDDSINRCRVYRSTIYYSFGTSSSYSNYSNYNHSMSPNPNLVYAYPATHTYSSSITFGLGSYFRIPYPPEIPI